MTKAQRLLLIKIVCWLVGSTIASLILGVDTPKAIAIALIVVIIGLLFRTRDIMTERDNDG